VGTAVKTKGIILNSIRWKESSKIVTVYTEDLGKIKLIARGVYKNKSPLAGKVETLFLAELIIDEKKSRTLNLLKEIDVVNTFSDIRLDMKIFPFSLVLLEIIKQLLDDSSPDSAFFNFFLEMQMALSRNKNPENVLIYFLIKLSSYLGFKPSLKKCYSGDFNLCDQKVYLSMSEGNISCKVCNKFALNIIPFKKDQFLYLQKIQKINHRQILKVTDDRIDFFQIIQNLLRYVNFHIDKEIKTDSLNLLWPHKF